MCVFVLVCVSESESLLSGHSGPAWWLLGIRPGPFGIVYTASQFLGIQLRLGTTLQAGAGALLLTHPVGGGIPEVAEHAIHFLQSLAAGLAVVLVVLGLLNGQVCGGHF